MERKELVDIISTSKKVIVSDYSDYEYNNSHNGGKYSYSIVGSRLDDSTWRVWYSTSSDIDFCSKYGKFQKCGAYTWDCDDCENGENIVSSEVFLDMIDEFISIDLIELDKRTLDNPSSFNNCGDYLITYTPLDNN